MRTRLNVPVKAHARGEDVRDLQGSPREREFCFAVNFVPC